MDPATINVKEALRNLNAIIKSNFKEVELSVADDKLWQETRSALLWQAPAFTYLLINMMSDKAKRSNYAVFTEEAPFPVAATDGRYMLLKPSTYFKNYTLPERVFIACHEVCHCMFNHCGMLLIWRRTGVVKLAGGKSLPFVEAIMQMAMDYVINAVLVESKIGKAPKDCLYDPTIATGMDSVVDTYAKLMKDSRIKIIKVKVPASQTGDGQGEGEMEIGERDGKRSFDQHLNPGSREGQNPTDADQQRSETAWRTAVNSALDAAKAQGKMPGALERLMREVVNPKIPWAEKVRGWANRKLGAGSSNWRRADRRLIVRDIYAPSRSSYACDLVVAGIDTSGSIGNAELKVFFGELRGVLDELRPRELHIVWCDATVHKVDIVTEMDDIYKLKPKGGGGTDFRPVFDYVDKLGKQPDALIYLTDLLGAFPAKQPRYPVLWGRTMKNVNPPWGEVVDVEIR